MPARTFPALVQVVVAVLVLGALTTLVLLSPSGDVTEQPRTVIGSKELVSITGPDGESVQTVARIDTGASSTSVDEEIAEDLGYDLEDADTVTIVSSLGEEERPVVPAELQLAGESFATRVNVTDRSDRSTLVLVGREDMGRFDVRPDEELLTTPGAAVAPATPGSPPAGSSVLGPTTLLAVLPLAALVVVALRVVLGLQTLGAFSPVLLAVGYSQAGLLPGLLLTLAVLALGLAAGPLLRRFHLPRVVRLAALVGVVSTALVLLQDVGGVPGPVDPWGASLPVVVAAVVVERLWETWETDGIASALGDAVLTLVVATLVTSLMLAPVVRLLADSAPVWLALGCTVWACVLGTYRGRRVVELVRFRTAAPAVWA